MIVRDDIPLGTTRDAEGRGLTFKNGTGYWYEYTRDAGGRALTYKESTGYWRERTYDAEGRALTFKDSDGCWYEYAYNAEGLELTFKKEGFSGTRIADDGNYVLLHDAEKDLFKAGCQGPLTRAEALEHWDRDDNRANLFTKAIQSGG